MLPHGLVLFAGATGCGKSTSLGAMIDFINSEKNTHIVTLEDPIEFLHRHKKSIIDQRQIETDSLSFGKALKSALRQDADVLMIGEIRDYITVSSALMIAETGHLVLSTIHTNDAAHTIDRIINMFPPDQHSQARMQLSSVLQGIISQHLIPRKDGKGRIAAREILIATHAVCNLIKDGKSSHIYSVIQTGGRDGMQTLDNSLIELARNNLISSSDALLIAKNKEQVKQALG